jgi:hypothetical protein
VTNTHVGHGRQTECTSEESNIAQVRFSHTDVTGKLPPPPPASTYISIVQIRHVTPIESNI